MNARIVMTIFRKELTDTLRDKRTLMAMIGVPLLLYPILFLITSQALIKQMNQLQQETSKVAIVGDDSGLLLSWVSAIERVRIEPSDDPAADLTAHRLDAVVRVELGARQVLDSGGTVQIQLDFDTIEPRSKTAADRLEKGLRKAAEDVLKTRLAQAGLNEAYATPIEVKQTNTAPPTKVAGSILGVIVPSLLILMIGLGAFYPAVDLTAGEKERGTLETLLSTPAGKLEIVTGKFLTVFTLAITTGLLNLGSMALTVWIQLSQLPPEALNAVQLHIAPFTLLLIFITIMPLALFISAAMMGVASFARSFREAQNYLAPIFIFLVLPSFLGAMPTIKLTPATQLIPIANVALFIKGLLMGEAGLDSGFMVIISTSAYAVLALVLAAGVFQREEIVLAGERGMSLSCNRAFFTPRPAPTAGFAVFLYLTALLLLFHIGSFLQARWPMAGILATQWGIMLGAPVALCWYTRIELRSTFNLRPPGWLPLGAAFLLAASWAILLLQIGAWQQQALPSPPELEEKMGELLQAVQQRVGLPGLLFVIALSPAICEEMLFRGALLSGFRQRLPMWAGMLIIGLLFGLIHLYMYRIPATALSGMLLTYLVWRSGSIFTSMLCHFMINASALLIETLGKDNAAINQYIIQPLQERHSLPPWLLCAALAVFAAGVLLMEFSTRARRAHGSP